MVVKQEEGLELLEVRLRVVLSHMVVKHGIGRNRQLQRLRVVLSHMVVKLPNSCQ